MNKFFLKMVAGVLALFAVSTSAQAQTVTVTPLPGVGSIHTLFGDGVSFGGVVLSSDSNSVPIGGLVYTVRSCSPDWGNKQPPFTNFQLVRELQSVSVGTMTYSREHGWQVLFPLRREVANGNPLLVVAETVSFSSAWQANQKCFGLTLEPSGVLTKSDIQIAPTKEYRFPLAGPQRTVVSARPIITVTRIGPENGRVRTTNDAVFRISISAQGEDFLLLDNLRPAINGSAPTGGFYEVFDEFLGGIITGRGLFFNGTNIVWQDGDQPLWGTMLVDRNTTRNFVVKVNSSVFNNAPGPDSLGISLDTPCSLEWNVIGSYTAGLCLDPDLVPSHLIINYE